MLVSSFETGRAISLFGLARSRPQGGIAVGCPQRGSRAAGGGAGSGEESPLKEPRQLDSIPGGIGDFLGEAD